MALKAKITALSPDILNLPVNEVLDLLKKITVTPVATTVKRNELLQLTQDAGEKIRTFFSRVKGKAITCGLRKECTHPHRAGTGQADPPQHVYIDFTDDWIRHVILNGLYDDEIRREIFGLNNLDTMAIIDLVVMIEGKETARDAASSSSSNAISQYRSDKKKSPVNLRTS